MAVPAFGTIGAFSSNASAATLTPALPASVASGNALVAFCWVNGTGKTIAVSSGWTVIDSINSGPVTAAWATRLATGTDSAPVFTWTGAAQCGANVLRFTGNNSTMTGTSNKATATSTTITTASLTSTANNSLVLIAELNNGSSIALPVPSDYTNISNGNNSSAGFRYASGTVYVSGSTTESTSVTVNSTKWASFAIEILGSGSTSNEPAARASQVSQEALFSYSTVNNARVSQVIVETLRTVAFIPILQRTQAFIID